MKLDGLQFVGRSHRYPIRAGLLYRMKGDRSWHEGTSLNVSESGILFCGDTPLAPDARFDVRLALPSAATGRAAPSIGFHATLVRSPGERVWAARLSGAVILRMRSEQGRARCAVGA
jgi:hypothetical protein